MRDACLNCLLKIRRYGNCRLQQIFLGIMGFCVVICFNVKFNKPVFHSYKNKDVKSACVIPKFDLFDSSISEFFWDVKPLRCEPGEPLMYIDSEGVLHVNQSLRDSKGYKALKCVCQPVIRLIDNVTFGETVLCTEPIRIASDYIYAKCTDKEQNVVYDGLLFGIDYKTVLDKRKFQNESENNLSVYLYGYDALSGFIAKRTMPETMKYLEEVLEAYTFNGYTKVGDNTWPNLGALLTGFIPSESAQTMNEAPFIWKNMSQNGYVTMFSEDYPRLSCFKGFVEPPTDHYTKPFFVAADIVRPVSDRDMRKVLLFMEYKNIKVGESSYLCLGNTPKHKIMIDHFKRFIETYGNLRKFGMSFNTELGHDYINFYRLADKDSLEFFKWMYHNRKLDNAVLIFYSDHGPRYSEIQNTNIGRVTGLMPIFSMFIPKHIKQRYPQIHENLLRNTERLTTAFDVHQTLLDISNGNFDYTAPLNEHVKGISLFRPVPEKRSCFDAEIPEHYCPCYASEKIDVNSPRVQLLAKAIVRQLNKLVSVHQDKCAKMSLNSVVKASLVKSNFERDKSMEERFSIRSFIYSNKEDTRYLLVIETLPGNARFEATVHYESDSNIEVSGEISRINRYGNQSSCIEERWLRIYCFCNKS